MSSKTRNDALVAVERLGLPAAVRWLAVVQAGGQATNKRIHSSSFIKGGRALVGVRAVTTCLLWLLAAKLDSGSRLVASQ